MENRLLKLVLRMGAIMLTLVENHRYASTVTPVFSGHSKIDKTKILKTNGSLMKVKSITEYF